MCIIDRITVSCDVPSTSCVLCSFHAAILLSLTRRVYCFLVLVSPLGFRSPPRCLDLANGAYCLGSTSWFHSTREPPSWFRFSACPSSAALVRFVRCIFANRSLGACTVVDLAFLVSYRFLFLLYAKRLITYFDFYSISPSHARCSNVSIFSPSSVLLHKSLTPPPCYPH